MTFVITVDPTAVIGGVPAAELRVAGKILHMDVELCKAITDAVRKWAIENSETPNVKADLTKTDSGTGQRDRRRFLLVSRVSHERR